MNTTKKICSFDQDQTLDSHAKPKIGKSGDNYIGVDHDEVDEDILSLCDLPVNCKNKQTSQHLDRAEKILPSNIESHPSPTENQENLFEFFSEEWNIVSSTTTSPKIAISKPVIPFPSPQADADDDDLVFHRKNISNSRPPKPRTKNAVLPRPTPQHIRSNSTRTVPLKPKQPIITKSKSYSSGSTSKSVEDQSKVSASPAKSKLLLVLFGLPPKVPTGQTMNDIKIRQSRHAPSTFFPSNSGGGCRDDQDAVPPGRRRSENRMWRFIKAATCVRSHHREKLSFDE